MMMRDLHKDGAILTNRATQLAEEHRDSMAPGANSQRPITEFGPVAKKVVRQIEFLYRSLHSLSPENSIIKIRVYGSFCAYVSCLQTDIGDVGIYPTECNQGITLVKSLYGLREVLRGQFIARIRWMQSVLRESHASVPRTENLIAKSAVNQGTIVRKRGTGYLGIVQRVYHSTGELRAEVEWVEGALLPHVSIDEIEPTNGSSTAERLLKLLEKAVSNNAKTDQGSSPKPT